jgi:hypothetical protein
MVFFSSEYEYKAARRTACFHVRMQSFSDSPDCHCNLSPAFITKFSSILPGPGSTYKLPLQARIPKGYDLSSFEIAPIPYGSPLAGEIERVFWPLPCLVAAGRR